MVERPQEKQYVHLSRSSRQVRPILSGIVFLLAANLVAKGVLGLSAFSAPQVVTPNLQGSLYLNFGQPHHNSHQSQILPYNPFQNDFWRPIQHGPSTTTPKPVQPISQQQIINIHDTGFGESAPGENYEDIHEQPQQQIVIEKDSNTFLTTKDNQYIISKYSNHKRETIQKNKIKREAKEKQPVKSVPELLFFNSKTGDLINKLADLKREINKKENQKNEEKEAVTEITDGTTIPDDVEIFDRNVTESDYDEITTIGRQVQTTTLAPTTTTVTTTTTASTTASTLPPTTTTQVTTITPNATAPGMNMTSNATGYNYTVNGYGPYTGNENVSITTMRPGTQNMTMTNATTGNMTGNATTPGPGYYYYPAGEYGPSNGNEHISITYGPPIFDQQNDFQHDNFYGQEHDERPFFSSPEDHFLNNQHQPQHQNEYEYQNYGNNNYGNNFNNFFEQHNSQFEPQISDTQKYNDIVNKFYNKYDYHYPSFYNNFVGK